MFHEVYPAKNESLRHLVGLVRNRSDFLRSGVLLMSTDRWCQYSQAVLTPSVSNTCEYYVLIWKKFNLTQTSTTGSRRHCCLCARRVKPYFLTTKWHCIVTTWFDCVLCIFIHKQLLQWYALITPKWQSPAKGNIFSIHSPMLDNPKKFG